MFRTINRSYVHSQYFGVYIEKYVYQKPLPYFLESRPRFGVWNVFAKNFPQANEFRKECVE